MHTQSNIFPHRKNQDGSWDTICTVCFGTIATRPHESALAQEEAAHICPHLTRPEIVSAPGPIEKILLHPRWRIDSKPENDEMNLSAKHP